MHVFQQMSGRYRVAVTSAASNLIAKITEQGVTLCNVLLVDELSFNAEISANDFIFLKKLIRKYGGSIRIIGRSGVIWKLVSYCKRPVLIVTSLLLMLLSLYLPTRVLFVRVEGNQNIPSAKIIESVQDCGVHFWASSRQVRSERVKNAVLGMMPELEWVGINTKGCVAVVSVKEGDAQIKQESNSGISSIVAARDGIIQEITVSRGTSLCKTGQAVTAGQVLVSPYTDCGLVIRAERAEAEIWAETAHRFTAISLSNYIRKGQLLRKDVKYFIQIGKKFINLRKDSGIFDTGCVKMYESIPLRLPGGFALPVTLVKVTYLYYETDTAFDEQSVYHWHTEKIDSYLRSQMVSGQILQRDITYNQTSEVCELNCEYACLEMIGVYRREEMITPYEQGNGTNR